MSQPEAESNSGRQGQFETNVALGDLRKAIASVKEAAAAVGRGPGGQEISSGLSRLREAYFWLEASLGAGEATLSQPGNLAHKG